MGSHEGRRFLVTGGTGFLGAALVNRLVARGDEVSVFDNNWRGNIERLSSVEESIKIFEGDIRDAKSLEQACEGVDAVIHMAFVNGTRFFYEQPELVLDVGVRGMLNVVDACRSQNVRDLVVASSSEVYQTPPAVPTDESAPLLIPDPLNPRYSYAGGKILSELITFNYGKTGFDRVCVFRPHNVYGSDMGWEHVIPEFSARAARAVASTQQGPVEFEIQGSGEQTRAFTHVDDFTDGLLAIIDRGEHMGLYHIGNPEEISIGDLAKMVVSCFGREAVIKLESEPEGATQRRCPDISKLRALGFEPTISLEKGLPAVVDWYAKNQA